MLKRVLSCMLILLLAAGCALAEGATLTVKGEGLVMLEADTASITLGVRSYAAEVRDAQQAVNASMDAVIEALAAAGVARADMYTSSISIYPEYDYDYDSGDSTNIKGYSASNTLTIVTEDTENVGVLIDAAFDAGANTLDDVRFSASDTQEASDQALRLAIQGASAKAKVMAEAAGMELGGILTMVEGENYGYVTSASFARNSAADEAAGAKTRVLAEKQQVTASVTMQFALLEK